MKIIFCLHHFLPDFVGGTEIYVSNLAKQLQQNNIEAVVLIPNLGIDKTEEYIHEGIRVIRYAENSIEDRAMILGKKKPDGLQEFSAIIKNENPGLVHFHELAPGRGINLFHVEEVHILKIPLVITFHVPFYTCLRGSLLYKGHTKCDGKINIKKCTACMYQQKNITGIKGTLLNEVAMALFHFHINPTRLNSSVGTAFGFPFVIDKMRKDLLRLTFLAEKIVVIADWYREVLKRNHVPNDKMIYIKQGLPNAKAASHISTEITLPIRVVYIGRITPLKGLHLLIEAVLQLPPEKIFLDIYGNDTADNYVSSWKEKTKDTKNINWKGKVASSAVIGTLSNYHLLCIPSVFEMSPLVIQEAFAAGLPVLASDVYGNAEQIKDAENGWLFRQNDPVDLKFKLENIIRNPNLIVEVKKNIPAANTFEKVGTDHIALYSSLLNNYKRD
ncbi:MAG: glycosyltransferase [Ginsengibacter sp.]